MCVCVCVCVSVGGESSKPIRELAVQLHRNKRTFIIQLGSCQAAQRKKTSNLVLLGEDAQKSGRRKTGTNKRRTKLITRVHCTQTKREECFKAASGRPACNLQEHGNKCGKAVPDDWCEITEKPEEYSVV